VNRAAAATPVARIRWTAAADGIAHAHRASWRTRTACGKAGVDERYAHPATSRCEGCVTVIESEAGG
jgi:hypothetical protein